MYINFDVAAAVCVSCQELTSTLREGNYSCLGEEVIFTCTVRDSSTFVLAWSSTEYIGLGGSLQFSTTDGLGEVEMSMIDGSIKATATVTNNTNVNGQLILESMLRITAVEPSVVTCSGTSGAPADIRFSISGTYACTYT
jgi:hypothetical protein